MIRALLPAMLVAYFLYRSRRQRVFLLGIPFLMFLGSAIFFDTLLRLPYVNKVSSRIDNNGLMMICVGLAWFICSGVLDRNRERPEGMGPLGAKRIKPDEVTWILIGALVIADGFRAAFRTGDVLGTLRAMVGPVFLGIGYALLRGILYQSSREDVTDFLGALVTVNCFAAALYVLHQGLHLPIYQGPEYLDIIFLGERVTRTFWFMPPLLLFSVAFLMAKPRPGAKGYVLLTVCLLAILISYTRYLVLTATALVLLVILLRTLKRQYSLAARGILTIVVFAGVIGGIAVELAPVQSQYLLMRIGPLTEGLDDPAVDSLFIRSDYWLRTLDMLRGPERYLGAGFVDEGHDMRVFLVNLWRADSVWIPILFQMGIVGVAGFVVLLLASGVKAWSLFWRRSGSAEFLGLALFLLLLGVSVEGFVSSSFMYWVRYPLGLWYLAFLTVEANRDSLRAIPEAATQASRTRHLRPAQVWSALL